MKLKQIALSSCSVLMGLGLVACNGGGSAGPTASADYGNLLVESAQNIGSYDSITKALYPIMLQAGNFASFSGSGYTESDYQKANSLNSASAYNFPPLAPLTTPSYFKATSVGAYAIQYSTPGQGAETDPSQVIRTASGLIIIPKNVTPRGVVVYFHPTTFGKNQVPSCLGPIAKGAGNMSANIPNYCNITSIDNTGAATFAMLAAVYAARGFVVVAPDYVGQGVDYNNVHPYVAYPENNVWSAFNMLPAMRKILADNNVPTSLNLPLFITGYSEGGGYALDASRVAQSSAANLLTQNNLTLKITSPQEGAYSLTDQMNFAFNDNNDGLFNCSSNPSYNCGNLDMMQAYPSKSATPAVSAMNNWNIVTAPAAAMYKPGLTSYVLTAAMYYSFHNVSGAYNYAMNPAFWSGINMAAVGGSGTANLYQLYSGIYGSIYTGSQISGAIVANTFTVNGYDPLSSPTITAFTPFGNESSTLKSSHYGTNSAGTLFINQGVSTNPDFIRILTNGSTYNWQSHSPINLIHMVYDSAVTVINAHQAYSCMKNGVSFAGSGNMVGSLAPCTTPASGNLIESTIIQNFQLTNNLFQVLPLEDATTANSLANSKFWTANAAGASLGTPYDHGDMFVQGSIVALCTFENQLNSGTNSGICPNL